MQKSYRFERETNYTYYAARKRKLKEKGGTRKGREGLSEDYLKERRGRKNRGPGKP